MKLNHPPISSENTIERNQLDPNALLSRLRNRALAYVFGATAGLAPSLAKSNSEGGHEEGRGVVENEVAAEFYNPKKVCPNPYLDEQGKSKFAQGFKVDVHGHVIKNNSDTNKDDCRTHPWTTLGVSYTGTINIPAAKEISPYGAPLNPNEEHFSQDGQEEHEFEDLGHLAHRFRLYLKLTLLNGTVDFGPVFGVGVGKGGENTQAILGGFVSVHPDRKHQHELSISARTGIGKDGAAGFESGLFYHYNLTRNFNFGAHCIVEGHQGEVHGGCGPSIGLKIRGFSLNAEVALGPHPEGGVNTHTHLALMFDVMKFIQPNLPESHGHPPH